jgi:hypothetical protein
MAWKPKASILRVTDTHSCPEASGSDKSQVSSHLTLPSIKQRGAWIWLDAGMKQQ